ncbi:ABC transporter permease subunit [Corticibacter populi]|nr:ABC transporter permease subunit [Corticibacter populi]RZS30231.1 amino acid ABC transporter membrane protein 1 (PAAT family) [Corticibacter populi]
MSAASRQPPAEHRRTTRIWPSLLASVLPVALFLAVVAVWQSGPQRPGLALDLSFLAYPANFDLSESLIRYSGADSYARALLAGLLNTLLVSACAIALASGLGLLLAAARLSSNPLLSRLAAAVVEAVRNVPLLLQLFAWYALLTTSLPALRSAWSPLPGVLLSNRGLWLPRLDAAGAGWWAATAALLAALLAIAWLRYAARKARHARRGWRLVPVAAALLAALAVLLWRGQWPQWELPTLQGFRVTGGVSLSPELCALLAGLSVYTSGSLAEVFRAAIRAVPTGQTEAAKAIGLGVLARWRKVVLPQAARIAMAPTTSQYVNIVKNSSLAVAIGFPDVMSVSNTIINQSGQAVTMVLLLMVSYCAIGLLIAWLMHGLEARHGQPD